MVENAFEYKQKWTAEIERCKRAGLLVPTPIPNPDDVIIDMRSSRATTEGPLDEREKVKWNERLQKRDAAQAEVNFLADACKRSRSEKMRDRLLSEWISEQFIFDLINDSLRDQYNTKLHNRSHNENASRAGEALAQYKRMKLV